MPHKRQTGEFEVKSRVQSRLLAEMEGLDTRSAEGRKAVEERLSAIIGEEAVELSPFEKARWLDSIMTIADSGPLAVLLADDTVTDVMINAPGEVYVVQNGLVARSEVGFDDEAHVLAVLNRMLEVVGEQVDTSHPVLETRLPGNLHVNVVTRPVAAAGLAVTIRRFAKALLTEQHVIDYGSATPEVMEFLRACVQARANIIVSGGGGSGKTTLLNVLSNFAGDDERIVTIEYHTAELQLERKQVIPLIARPLDRNTQDEVTVGDLVRNAVFMRPDRVVVGECRGGETLDLVQVMARGFGGSMASVHANSPRDALSRLEVMCLMANADWPSRAIRELIGSALNIIVQCDYLRDHSRKITAVAEVQGMEGDVIALSNIFKFEQTGVDKEKIVGRLRPTGVRPKVVDRIVDAGIQLPPSIFFEKDGEAGKP